MTFGVGCILEDCDQRHYARGFCERHYRWVLRKRCLGTNRKRPRVHVARGCSVEDCERPHKAKGYCHPHYDRARLGRPMAGQKRDTSWEVLLDYLECGYSAPLIAQRLGVCELTIHRQCERNERMDLWRRATVRVA